MQAIYEGSFPRKERSPFADLAASIDRSERLCFLAWEGEAVAGFAIALPLDVPGVHLLEYLAVAEGLRGRGLGAALLRAVREHLDRPGAVGIILEVEPEATSSVAQRRIAFYQRHGALLLELERPYLMAADNEAGLLEMRLMWLSLGSTQAVPSAGLVASCIHELWVRVYGRSPEDPALREMLGGQRHVGRGSDLSRA